MCAGYVLSSVAVIFGGGFSGGGGGGCISQVLRVGAFWLG